MPPALVFHFKQLKSAKATFSSKQHTQERKHREERAMVTRKPLVHREPQVTLRKLSIHFTLCLLSHWQEVGRNDRPCQLIFPVTMLRHLPKATVKEESLLGLMGLVIMVVLGACGTVCLHHGGSGSSWCSRTRQRCSKIFQGLLLVTYFLQLGNSQRFYSFPNYCHHLGNRHSEYELVRGVLDSNPSKLHSTQMLEGNLISD